MPEADLRAVEAFLYHEAALLDARRFQDWLDLYTEDATYWIPLLHGQENPHDWASIIYDDRMAMELRVRQFEAANRHAQQPVTRTSHLIGNVVFVQGADGGNGRFTVNSACHVLESRGEKLRHLGGRCTHTLATHGDGFKIAAKRIDLVNCDAPHDGFNVPI